MALGQSALLELSESLRTADSGELMRMMLLTMLQSLVDSPAASSWKPTTNGKSPTAATFPEKSRTELATQNNDTPSKEVVDNRAAIAA